MSDIHLSEIFPLTFDQLNIASFRLSPTIGQEIGNSLGWHFSKQFPGVVVVWKQGFFWILTQSNIKIPPQKDWKEALAAIQLKIKDKIGDRSYFIQWVNEAIVDADIIAQLAVRILKLNCRFTPKIVFDQNKVQVKRECKFWAETFEIENELKPAITLDLKSSFVYRETLDVFFNNHPYRNDPEKLLIGLLVRDVETNGTGTIVEINGIIEEQRAKLIEQATGATSKEKLLIAPADQPVVTIEFSKNSRPYDYAMAALRPCLNSKTASKFEIEYSALSEHSKITYQERKQLLSQYKQDAHKALVNYGLKLERQCLNSKQYPGLFWKPQVKLEDTLLLFGNNTTSTKGQTLKGLYEGGVYRRHQEFNNPERKIRVGVLNFSTIDDIPFACNLQQELDKHKNNKFQLKFISENIRKTSLAQLSETEAKVKIETLIDEILQIPVDLVLIFLPESDRGFKTNFTPSWFLKRSAVTNTIIWCRSYCLPKITRYLSW